MIGMQRRQAFKYELMPNGETQRLMRRFAGSCRFVYNKALALQKENYEAGAKHLSYVTMAAWLPAWKREEGQEWLKDSPSQALQHALKDLDKAYQNFFAKRAGFPRFKRKGSGDSFRYPDPKQIKLDQGNSRIFLPKLGWIRYRNSREVLGEVRNVTVSCKGGKWLVSIQTLRQAQGIAQREVESPATQETTAIGQIANARRDFLHKATTMLRRRSATTISQNHAIVFVEDLRVRNMSKSSAGTADNHGKHGVAERSRGVAQKSGLNKAILDQGWGEFRRQLDYKTAWSGGMLLAVPAHHTSQICPCCTHVAKDNRQTQAKFACVECGYANHADVVGAINVLERGHRLLACGDGAWLLSVAEVSPSMKQEPTEGVKPHGFPPVGIPFLGY